MDGKDGVLSKHGLTEEYKLTEESDMWRNLVSGEGNSLYTRKILYYYLFVTVLHLYCCLLILVMCSICFVCFVLLFRFFVGLFV